MQLKLEQAGQYTECFSRGLLSLAGHTPPEQAIQAAAKFNVDISSHISQPLLRSDIDRAGLVLVMESQQRLHIGKMRPAQIGKCMLLSQLSDGREIPDPIGQDERFFEATYTQIAEYADSWVARFTGEQQ